MVKCKTCLCKGESALALSADCPRTDCLVIDEAEFEVPNGGMILGSVPTGAMVFDIISEEGSDVRVLYETSTPVGLPKEPEARKKIPLVRGLLDYFPDALAAVAEVSRVGNEQHNPGEPMHWARGKSMDQADSLIRHLIDRGKIDSDGQRHSAKVAWRALALLQLELEGDKSA